MKKTLVAVVLALAGLSSLAFADKDVFVDSWLLCDPTVWMGENQDGYKVPGLPHSISNANVSVAVPVAGNVVSSFTYSMGVEAWAGRIVQAGSSGTGTWDLTTYTQLKFKLAKPAGSPDITVEKFFMTDANNIQHSAGPVVISTTNFSQEITIDLTGYNLTAVNQLLGFIIKRADNGGGSGAITFFVDEIRYVGGGKGEVIVKVIGGKRGISVSNRINFGSVTAGSITNSATLDVKNFVISNIGDITGSSETVKLNLVNPTGWSAVQQIDRPLVNKYTLDALFNTIPPGVTDFSNYSNPSDGTDALSITPTAAIAPKFKGDIDGAGIQIGTSRNLYLMFFAPDQTSHSTETKIYLEVGF